jgi:hypothetical protein
VQAWPACFPAKTDAPTAAGTLDRSKPVVEHLVVPASSSGCSIVLSTPENAADRTLQLASNAVIEGGVAAAAAAAQFAAAQF